MLAVMYVIRRVFYHISHNGEKRIFKKKSAWVLGEDKHKKLH